MTTTADTGNDLVRSYLFLRRAIGLIGLALPPVLIIGKLLLDGPGLQNSISGYYYTEMRDVYVGAMCAVGMFLLSYKGHRPIDDLVGNLAALSAIGVALFPTSPTGGPNVTAGDDQTLGFVHVAFAAVFFVSLAVFCFMFTRHDGETPGARKSVRNKLYVACGVTILACLALIVVFGYLYDAETKSLHPALWLESAAVWAFGIAWLTKGRAIAPLNG